MESSPLPVKGANFDLCSALIQQGFFYVSHLQGASAYNGHLRWPLTLALIAELLTVELSLPVLTTSVFRSWDMSTQPSLCGANALTHCTTHGKICADTNNMLKHSLVHFLFFTYDHVFLNHDTHFPNDNTLCWPESLGFFWYLLVNFLMHTVSWFI